MINSIKFKRSQVSVEFIILLGVVLFFFVIFFAAIQESSFLKIKQKNDLLIKEVAFIIKNEITLASKSSEGYYREFEISEKIAGQDYQLSITNNMVYVITNDEKYAIAFPVLDVNGQPVKGTNIIKKQNGKVYLNS